MSSPDEWEPIYQKPVSKISSSPASKFPFEPSVGGSLPSLKSPRRGLPIDFGVDYKYNLSIKSGVKTRYKVPIYEVRIMKVRKLNWLVVESEGKTYFSARNVYTKKSKVIRYTYKTEVDYHAGGTANGSQSLPKF